MKETCLSEWIKEAILAWVVMGFFLYSYWDNPEKNNLHSMLSSDKILLIFSVLQSISFATSILSSMYIFPLAEKYGRKFLFLVMTLMNISHSLLLCLSKPFNSLALMIMSRLVYGICWGLSSNIVIYFGENSTITNRGLVA